MTSGVHRTILRPRAKSNRTILGSRTKGNRTVLRPRTKGNRTIAGPRTVPHTETGIYPFNTVMADTFYRTIGCRTNAGKRLYHCTPYQYRYTAGMPVDMPRVYRWVCHRFAGGYATGLPVGMPRVCRCACVCVCVIFQVLPMGVQHPGHPVLNLHPREVQQATCFFVFNPLADGER